MLEGLDDPPVGAVGYDRKGLPSPFGYKISHQKGWTLFIK